MIPFDAFVYMYMCTCMCKFVVDHWGLANVQNGVELSFCKFQKCFSAFGNEKKIVVRILKKLVSKMYWMAAYDDYDKNFLF